MFERKLTRKQVELIKEIEAFIKDKHSLAQVQEVLSKGL